MVSELCSMTITQFAAFKAGIILVNLNPAYKSNQLEFVLNKVSCKRFSRLHQYFKTTDYQEILTPKLPHEAGQGCQN